MIFLLAGRGFFCGLIRLANPLMMCYTNKEHDPFCRIIIEKTH